ncbi:MAG TPA: BON domain-containing protein [Gammaproteobacteria bacterium]|nr:BON domain-containing protein [Gammaproteobacteria bacterium]
MKRMLKLALISSALVSLPVLTQESGSEKSFEGAAKDAWLVGKVEMAFTLNEHLNPFSIDTDVDNGIVSLTGTVESDIDRDLAEEIAVGVEGVTKVDNALTVEKSVESDSRPHSPNWFTDATTTANVKTRLIANENIDALAIDVDTENAIVTLSGRVRTDEEKDLSAKVAQNTPSVDEVRNLLVVDEGN